MSVPIPIGEQKYTPEAFLKKELSSRIKLEYYNGRIIPMAGGTATHNKIALRIGGLLMFSLDDKPFEVYNSDMKIYIPHTNSFVYPDAVVISVAPAFYEGREDILTNPLLVVEVVATSNLHAKFDLYRQIPGFQEYILISQDKAHVSVYTREAADLWRTADYEGFTSDFLMRSIDTRLKLSDIYKGVSFE